jgi:hypothetical protein
MLPFQHLKEWDPLDSHSTARVSICQLFSQAAAERRSSLKVEEQPTGRDSRCAGLWASTPPLPTAI